MQNDNQMHPQDMRNLILFAVFSIGLWLAYDHFIARPHALELQKAAQQAKLAAASAPSEIMETAIVKPRAEIIAQGQRVQGLAAVGMCASAGWTAGAPGAVFAEVVLNQS